jgi:hypothetical protein
VTGWSGLCSLDAESIVALREMIKQYRSNNNNTIPIITFFVKLALQDPVNKARALGGFGLCCKFAPSVAAIGRPAQ